MKLIRNLFLALALTITSVSSSQTSVTDILTKMSTPKPQVFQDWQLSNAGGYGVASFYWKITKLQVNDSTWKFTTFFYSNSYRLPTATAKTPKELWASTYVSGIYMMVDGYYLMKETTWLLFKDQYSNQLTTFTTKNPYPKIQLVWSKCSIY